MHIALKALSPAVNDPTTAAMCIDHLTALITECGSRVFPSPLRFSNGKLRVIAQLPTFSSLVQTPVDEIRLAAAAQPSVLRRLVRLIETAETCVKRPERRHALGVLLRRIAVSAESLSDAQSRLTLREEIRPVQAVL